MRETITISVPRSVKRKLDVVTKSLQLNRSDVVRKALNQYFARQEFRRLRGLLVPAAEKQGVYTDEDVFRRVS